MTSYQKRLQEIKALKERLYALEKLYLIAMDYPDLPHQAVMYERYKQLPLTNTELVKSMYESDLKDIKAIGTIDNAQVDATQPCFYGGKRGASMSDSVLQTKPKWTKERFDALWHFEKDKT
jgi:hypothetical protein